MARGLFRHPPHPQQRHGLAPAFLDAPPPASGCWANEVAATSPSWWLRLGESSGTFADEIGTNDGTGVNTPTYSATSLLSGDSNTAVTLTAASTEYITVAHATALDVGSGDWSMGVWFKLTSASQTLVWLMSKGTDQPNLFIDAAGKLAFDNFAAAAATSSGVVNGDTNRHWAVATHTVGNVNKVWFDGVDVTGTSGTPAFTSNTEAFTIGIENDLFGPIGATIDEPVVWKGTVLTSTQISVLYASESVACGGTNYDRTLADTVAVANTVARVGTFLRAATDAVSLANIVERIATLARTVTDTVTVGNTVARALVAARTAADSVSFSESVAGSKVIIRTVADAVGFSDAVARVLVLARAVTDTVTVGNTVARVVTAVRTATDTVTLGDSVARVGTFLRTAADSVGIAEAVTQLKVILRSVADSVTIGNTVARTVVAARTAADAVSIGDSVNRVVGAVRSASDAVSVSEAVTQLKVILRSLADSVSVGNTVARVVTAVRSLADSVTVGNTVARVTSAIRTVADTVALADAVTRVATLFRTAADSVTLGNVVAAIGSVASFVGGFPPVASARAFIARATGRPSKPGGSASNPKPDGS